MEMDWSHIIAIVLSVGSVVVGGLWTLHQSIKSEFRETKLESESRMVRTHERVDGISKDIRENYVHKDLHREIIKRVDGEMDSLRRQIGCPMVDKP
jgi:FtsZ-interacting cell division protein ZipA